MQKPQQRALYLLKIIEWAFTIVVALWQSLLFFLSIPFYFVLILSSKYLLLQIKYFFEYADSTFMKSDHLITATGNPIFLKNIK